MDVFEEDWRYQVVEVGGFSQSVDVQKALPHSAPQAGGNAHPDEPLHLESEALFVCLFVGED